MAHARIRGIILRQRRQQREHVQQAQPQLLCKDSNAALHPPQLTCAYQNMMHSLSRQGMLEASQHFSSTYTEVKVPPPKQHVSTSPY